MPDEPAARYSCFPVVHGGSERISQRARDGIEAAGGVRALSVASAWEMAIKTSLGKLALAKPLGELLPPLLADAGIELLPIEIGDVARVATLPFHHRDPFDRLLAAQALERGFTIVSIDEAFDLYGVTRLW